MSLRHDYILRLIRQLAQAIGRLVSRAQNADPEEVWQELEQALEDLTGLDLPLLRRLPLEQLLGGLRMGEGTDSIRTLAAAEVLAVDAELNERSGRPEDETAKLRFKALGLYAVALSELGDLAQEDTVNRGLGLLEALNEWRMPPAVGLKVLLWFEQRLEFARGEDLLFDLMESDSTGRVSAAGLDFYSRLLEIGDEELERGGLPREEILTGMKELAVR
ncbi:MAG: DUF6483 family protein [Thermoanaerobaculales bacterium]|nr:DUF6483 family protein [Thermoanaerobaculales bacterium]